ncbi:hypothetical protein A4D02_32860 [Niastella koreensis]|uniref:Peptidase S9 prolyl oligopeptidase active site domain protein n=2 Tax=Niastella koreensis TaxID=354356 RepID=G8T8N9_NIAKG|nr:prolyl oligopeptidase family serine peptidase [Niastella koreensis]AEW01219.1 peptidase S9 prolyl oligopeptidase active site domain protein [Niastella koreensis GR20-10]OQP45984.1 hypothetical protein A4D02_32860 [Niastella koreensis]
MKNLILYITFSFYALPLLAQKRSIDHSVYGRWMGSDKSSFYNSIISKDGKRVIYFAGAARGAFTMFIHELETGWKKEVQGVRTANLIFGDKILIYHLPSDTLVFLNLIDKSIEVIGGVQSYKVPTLLADNLIVYRTKDMEVIVRDFSRQIEKSFQGITDYYLNGPGTSLLLQSEVKVPIPLIYLRRINMANFSADTIFKSNNKVEGLIFDREGNQTIFFVKGNEEKGNTYKIMFLNHEMRRAVTLISENTKGINSELRISPFPAPKFSPNGKRLFFTLRNFEDKSLEEASSNSVKLDVWHYLDKKLQTEQLNESDFSNYINAIYDIKGNNLVAINSGEDDARNVKLSVGGNGDYALVFKKINNDEKFWNQLNKLDVLLVSLKDGTSRTLVKGKTSIETADVNFSPSGNYVIWPDRMEKQYYSYNVNTGQLKKITTKVPVPLFADNTFPSFKVPYGISGWLKDDSFVLINDNFDIWKIDPKGYNKPLNITNNYGRKHKLRLRVSTFDFGELPVFSSNSKILIKVFNLSNWDNGFFQVQLGYGSIDPKLLVMGPYDYIPIVKAKQSEVFIIKRYNCEDAPNLFWTRSFQDFQPISDIHPQSEFNWMTAELIRWKMFDGNENEGILFKPENFDPKLKYPVIFNFYQYPGLLHYFRYPEPSNGEIDIPYFVSNGYVVFRPGIKFIKGRPGYSAYNSTVSAIRYLSKYSWFDSSRLGLSGISYGGYETNYLVTQTNVFAAAAPAAGMSDLVSDYNGLWNNESKQFMYEKSQGRIGVTLWQNPGLYIQNSPIFSANKVKTPILILHNKGDKAVSWGQGVEWFTALRRLGKKAWMLQYDGEEHGLYNYEPRIDYSIRLSQFFDHYLKGDAVPLWMSRGIPAMKKGKDLGLTLDLNGSCGSDCKICQKELHITKKDTRVHNVTKIKNVKYFK